MKQKLVRISCLLLCLVLLLSSCSFFETDITVDLTDYMIIRSDSAEDKVAAAAVKLNSTLRNEGINLKLTTDYVNTNKNETVPTDTKEILVGPTNRAESTAVRYLDYEIKFVNNRIVINGGCVDALNSAIDWFLENCINEEGNAVIPSKGYHYSASYPNEDLTVGGVALKEFTFESTKDECDAELLKWLGENVGIHTGASTGKTIRFVTDESYPSTTVSFNLSGSDLLLTCSTAMSTDHTWIVDEFLKALKAPVNSAVTVGEQISVKIDQVSSVSKAGVNNLRNETDEAIEDILNTSNMTIPAGAKKYYVSTSGNDSNNGTSPSTPWKTVKKVNETTLSAGSYVCFKRGDTWRCGNDAEQYLKTQNGVTYTAYGDGEKPKFYGSPYDAADPNKWESVAPNIWYLKGSENFIGNVGALVFNGGEEVSTKVTIVVYEDSNTKKTQKYNFKEYDLYNKSHNIGMEFNDYRDLKEDLEIYQDVNFNVKLPSGTTYSYTTGNKKLYLYSTSNPGYRFDSIEVNIGRTLMNAAGSQNVTFDNLCLMYGGVHGIQGSGQTDVVKNLTVQNCVFGWLGGSTQSDNMGQAFQIRLGNAVEIYGACDGFTVENNYIYQMYDTGMTVQANYYNVSNDLRNGFYMKNVQYLDNVIENCEMAFEIWMTDIEENNPSRMENYLVKGNKVWYTSYGFCEQRPYADRGWSACVKNRCSGTGNRAYNYSVEDNLFAFWKNRALQCTSNLFNPEDDSDSLPFLSGNTYIEEFGKKFAQYEVVVDDVAHIDAKYDFSAPGYLIQHKNTTTGAYVEKGHTDKTDKFLFYTK